MTIGQNIGALLQALQRRPSGRPYVVALVASILWVGGLLYIGLTRVSVASSGRSWRA
jgi:hypothetical protein